MKGIIIYKHPNTNHHLEKENMFLEKKTKDENH